MQKLLLAIVILVAGCVSAPDGAIGGGDFEQGPTTPSDGDGTSNAPTNLWLLDGLRPVSNTKVSNGAEPSILADRNGEFLWIGDTTGAYYSQDNGTTWGKMANFLLPVRPFIDGWALAQDDTGRLYAAALIGPEIDVGTSTDGKTWATTTRAAAVSGTTDRPWLAAQGDGDVVLFYFDAPAVATGFYEHCARSTDKGATWLDRDPAAGRPQGGNAIFDDAGNFYYANDDGIATRFAGSCAGNAQTLQLFNNPGVNNMIQLATDGQAIYSAAATGGGKAITVAGTKDFQRVTTRVVSPAVLQSSTFATISAHGDQVAVAWYGSETPGDPSSPDFAGQFNVYVAIIDDFWGTPAIRNIRVTDVANHVGGICMGGLLCDGNADRDLLDYFMIDYDKWGGIHIAYGHDGSGSSAVVRYAQIPASIAQPVTASNGTTDLPPVAAFTLTANGLNVRVDASASSDPEGGPLSYVWNWGDGSANDAGRTAVHTYPKFGAFTVTLSVTDAVGQTTAYEENILVEEGARSNLLPVADFSVVGDTVGDKIVFQDRSKDADGSIVAWAWAFGDGKASTVASPTHTYTTAGEKVVTLTVTDDWGESDSYAKTLTLIGASGAGEEVPDAVQSGDDRKRVPGIGVLFVFAALFLASRRQ